MLAIEGRDGGQGGWWRRRRGVGWGRGVEGDGNFASCKREKESEGKKIFEGGANALVRIAPGVCVCVCGRHGFLGLAGLAGRSCREDACSNGARTCGEDAAATEQGLVEKMQQQRNEVLRRRCLLQTPGWFVKSTCSRWSARCVACFELATLVQRMRSLAACVCVGRLHAFSSGGTGLGSWWNVNGSSEPEVKWKAQQ